MKTHLLTIEDGDSIFLWNEKEVIVVHFTPPWGFGENRIPGKWTVTTTPIDWTTYLEFPQ